MLKLRPSVAGVAIAALAGLVASAAALSMGCPPASFDRLKMFLEFNSTDVDGEIVIDLKTDTGLKNLEVRGPDGRKRVIKLESNDSNGIGLAEVFLESGEPNLELSLGSYPVGVYQFSGKDSDGTRYCGEVFLNHDLLAPPVFSPSNGEEVDPDQVTVEWVPVDGAISYFVEVENDELGSKFAVTVPSTVTSLDVSPQFFEAGTEYEIGVRAIAANGNVTVSESDFVTES